MVSVVEVYVVIEYVAHGCGKGSIYHGVFGSFEQAVVCAMMNADIFIPGYVFVDEVTEKEYEDHMLVLTERIFLKGEC